MIHVLDAGPMIAFLNGESGEDVVEEILADVDDICYAHALNLCEVYYGYLRSADETVAQQAIADLLSHGIIVCEDMDTDFWQSVGRLKAAGSISIADCFCIALAQRLGGEVVTTDHHEFDALVPLGIVPIRFIR